VEKCADNEETMWRNNFTFVKDVHIIYVTFITVVIIVCEKNETHYFRTDLRMFPKLLSAVCLLNKILCAFEMYKMWRPA
jgi:hypothetical protein